MARTDTAPQHSRVNRFPRGPRWGQATGALSLSVSAICIELSGAATGTVSAYRCLLALPALALIALPEYRREGPPPRRQLLYGIAAGALFAGDALLWAKSIWAGCGLVLVSAYATVAGHGERPSGHDGSPS